MSPTTAGLAELLAADAVLERLDGAPGSLAFLEALRACLPRERVALAAELALARTRVGMRHPLGARGFYTARGLEQCTAAPIARVRAGRARACARGVVLDATCGVGGDALALAAAGAPLVALDRDPLLAACARANLDRAGLSGVVAVGEALRPPVRADLLVLDPDRRAGGRRSLDPWSWSPSLPQALELAATVRGACLELAPATDPDEIERAGAVGSLQWISLDGELRELALWTGALAEPQGETTREALALRSDGTATRLAGPPHEVAPLAEGDAHRIAYLADPDPAVVRSGLLGNLAAQLDLAPLAPQLAYLGGAERPDSPLVRAFAVVEACACDARTVRRMLARHDVGGVRVRKRGHPEPAEVLARRFRGRGRRPGELAVARLERGHVVFLLERLPRPGERRGAGPAAGRGVGDEGFEPPTSSL